MNATAEMQWRSPLTEVSVPFEAVLTLPTTPFLDDLPIAAYPGVRHQFLKRDGEGA